MSDRDNPFTTPSNLGIALDRLLRRLETELSEVFENENYNHHLSELEEDLELKVEVLARNMEDFARVRGFAILQTPAGQSYAPLIDGRFATLELFEALPEPDRRFLEAQEPVIREEMDKTLREIRLLRDEAESRRQNLDREIVAEYIREDFDVLEADYADWEVVTDYLQLVREAILEHVDRYKPAQAATSAEKPPMPTTLAPNVFISYVRDNADQVDKLAAELRQHGVNVWLDRNEIMPGADWQYAIRQAIKGGDYFIACFSVDYVARPDTFMNTEIGLAVEMLQRKPTGGIWFIPVLLSECEIPDRTIGGGQTLRDLQWEPLYEDWEKGVGRILKAMRIEMPDILTIDEPIHLELVRIPAGIFLMRDDMVHVNLAEFYIGKCPITNAQYAAFLRTMDHRYPNHWEDGRIPIGKENHPVVYVSWDDAVDFCVWLSGMASRKFTLPTEEEWERAARGVFGRLWPWGYEKPTKDNELCNFLGSGIGDTTPVGLYPKGASSNGVLDMAGNVWEWTQKGVLRGGSFRNDEWLVRCTSRSVINPYAWLDNGGFRVCVPGP